MQEKFITNDSIKKIVDYFYLKIRVDESLGPIFENAIGKDEKTWEIHLEKMYKFWTTLMFSSEYFVGDKNQYKGNPLKVHQGLPPFEKDLFKKWLKLFHETAHELHEKEVADKYIQASNQIASNLKNALFGPEIFSHDN